MSHGRESTPTFSYMDGIPVKISEKYKPPRKVTLPVGFQQRLGHETLSEEYDFRLEHSVLKKLGEWRALRKAATETREERIKAHDTVHQERLSNDVQKLSLKSGERKFETAIPDSSGCSSCKYSHPTVSSTTSHDTYPNAISLCRVVFTNSSQNDSSSSVSYSNLELGSSPIIVGPNPSKVSRQSIQYSHRTSILTPVPISQMSSSIDSSKSSSQFNISDFEADTSSPFDNMELKTINEMEELAHVLQPVSNSPNKNDSSRSDVDLGKFSPHSNYNLNQDTVVNYNTVGSKSTKEPIVLPHLNGLTAYSSYNTTPRIKERDTRSENYVTTGNNIFNHTSNMPQNLGNMYGFYPHETWNVNIDMNHPGAYQATGNGDMKPNVAANISSGDHVVQPVEALSFVASENAKPLTSGMSFPSTYNQLPRNEDQHSPRRTLSKSVPDIVQELEKELAEKHVAERSAAANRTSHTPPPRPNSFGSTGLEDWEPWPELDSPEQFQARGKKSSMRKNTKKEIHTLLPNPFHELPVALQHLVSHISEMGFALPRVARACKLFGEDHKKVVEFLLQVQNLEEQKWPGDLAEKALIINDCDISEAVKYLEALIQLLDLGFPEDKVSEALVRFSNDRDKALDHLIS